MDSAKQEQSEEQSAYVYGDQYIPLNSPGTIDIFGEPAVLPRVGDRYQVKIPLLRTELNSLQLRTNTVGMRDSDNCIGMSPEIPITWVRHAESHTKHEQEEIPGAVVEGVVAGSVDSRDNEDFVIDANCDIMTGYSSEKLTHHDKLPNGVACKQEISNDLSVHNIRTPYQQPMKVKGYIPLPGSPATPWTDAEAQSFLLALYIFGKNLVQVKNFVEYKKIGDILSYYYGKFYRSDAHRRWSECRKIRSRKCIHGVHIFIGRRQQELLSRLMPLMSKDVQDTLQEASRLFNEGRASLEEYVFTLKATVGVQVLVDAVGIGKGKQDLTGIVLDPVRKKQVSIRPEIPIGKACSSLTPGDIIKFLTTGFRLSKARSNDLFWEAVWPRLLARGWHSEQPKNLAFVGSKHALVFLVPGIKKFSRRKLVKGNHYFDSVSDVLNKVAADPRIIELEVEGAKGSSDVKAEYGQDMDVRSDHNGRPDCGSRCYLHPRIPNYNSELMKFTVVDTTMVEGDTPFTVRELRILPTSSYVPSTPSGESRTNSSEEQQNSADIQMSGRQEPRPRTYAYNKFEDSNGCICGKEVQFDGNDIMITGTVSERSSPVNEQVPGDKDLDPVNTKKPAKVIKRHISRRRKSCKPDSFVPSAKRPRLTSCNKEGMQSNNCSFPRGHQLNSEGSHVELESCRASDIVGSEVYPSQRGISTDRSANSNLVQRYEHVPTKNYYSTGNVVGTTMLKEELQPRVIFDLNLPFIPEFDCGEPFFMEAAGIYHDQQQAEPACLSDSTRLLVDAQVMGTPNGVFSDQQPVISTRRQSTRNRPPTAKALEALASGLIGRNRKARGASTLKNRPSRRARRTVRSPIIVPNTNPAVFSSDIRKPNVGMDEWYGANGNHERMLSESRVQSERKEILELFGVL